MISSRLGATRLSRHTASFSATISSTVSGTVPSALSRIGLPLCVPDGAARALVDIGGLPVKGAARSQITQAARRADAAVQAPERLDQKYQPGLAERIPHARGLCIADRLRIERVTLGEFEQRFFRR